MKRKLWPRSLLGQMLLSVALALLVAQGISGFLLYRAQEQRREAALMNAAAFRLLAPPRSETDRSRWRGRLHKDSPDRRHWMRGLPLEQRATSPIASSGTRSAEREAALAGILDGQGISFAELEVAQWKAASDPYALEQFRERRRFRKDPDLASRTLVVAALQREDGGNWLVARILLPDREPRAFGTLIFQTLVLYVVLVGGLALLLRRITRPLAELTRRVEHFSRTREADGQVAPQGPDDIRRLIDAQNAMEARILALLDEKDVMLGAIGHDLKTPLAALRVRIESVEDETQRTRMAAGIEDITRTLDDILSLARVGRPSDLIERTELAALTASVVEEFEDMDEPVELGETTRIAAPVRATWLRRALRNLIANALRYGKDARVSVRRDAQDAVIRVDDDGPGIPEAQIEAMMEPFARGEPSRSRETGGAGLGLALARAIAEQHGGTLRLSNRVEGGLRAELRIPAEPAV